jgi:mycothiol synthase
MNETSGTRLPQLLMLRPTLNDLPPLIPPVGFSVRPAGPADIPGVAAILSSSFQDPGWSPGRVRADLFGATDVKEVLVAVKDDGTVVATASVQVPPREIRRGLIHMVGASSAYSGKRLGYTVSLAVLQELRLLGCTEAALSTDDFRLAAIKTYLNLGFVPLVNHASHPERWKLVAEDMGIGPLPSIHEVSAR